MASKTELEKDLVTRLDAVVAAYITVQVEKEEAFEVMNSILNEDKYNIMPKPVKEAHAKKARENIYTARKERNENKRAKREERIEDSDESEEESAGAEKMDHSESAWDNHTGFTFTAGATGGEEPKQQQQQQQGAQQQPPPKKDPVGKTAAEIQQAMNDMNKRIAHLRTLKPPDSKTDADWSFWLTKESIRTVQDMICVPGLEEAISANCQGKADPTVTGKLAEHFKAKTTTGTTEGKDFTTQQTIINEAMAALFRAVLGDIIVSYTFMWLADYILNMFGPTNIKADTFKEQYKVYETKKMTTSSIYRKLLKRDCKNDTGAPLIDEKDTPMKWTSKLFFMSLKLDGTVKITIKEIALNALAANVEAALTTVGRSKKSVVAFFKDMAFKLEYCKGMNQMVFPNKKTRNGEGGTTKFAISDPTFSYGMYFSKGHATFLTAAHFGTGSIAAGLLSWYAGENKKGRAKEVLAQKAYQQRLQELKIRTGAEAYNHVFDAAGAPKANQSSALNFLLHNHIVRGGMNPPKMHTVPPYMLSKWYEAPRKEWITGNKLAALCMEKVLSFHPTRGNLPLPELEVAAITGIGWLPIQVSNAVGVDLKISSDWNWEKAAGFFQRFVTISACLVGGVTAGKGGPGQVAGASYGGANTTTTIYQKAKQNRDSTVHSGFGSSERERNAQMKVEQKVGWKFVTIGGEQFTMSFPENPIFLQAHAFPE